MSFELRPYQSEIISETRSIMQAGNRNILITAPTGSGKTVLTATMIRNSFLKGLRSMFIVHRRELVKQSVRTLKLTGIDCGVISAGFKPDYSNPVQVASIQSLVRRMEHVKKPDLVVWDECFPGDMEILSEEGFVKFEDLDKKKKVAQYNQSSGKVSFTKPLRHIEKEYDGLLLNFKSPQKISLTCTPGHDLLFKKQGKIAAHKAKMNHEYKYFSAAKPDKSAESLDLNHQLAIAVQADGSIQRKGEVNFSFVKKRKIENFITMCSRLNLEVLKFKDVIQKNRKTKQRFRIKTNTTKKIYNHIDLSSLSQAQARAIIEEVVLWDGSKYKCGGYYYSSVDPLCVDFYQAVCIIAGYHSNKSIQIDSRKESYQDVHRLFIKKEYRHRSLRGVAKTTLKHKGKVYCVEVPNGNIIVRHNGKVIITGNCHHIASKTWADPFNLFSDSYQIGLTATPERLDGKGLNDYFKVMVKGPDMSWLIDNGYLSKYKVYAPTKPNLKGVKRVMGDYQKTSLNDVMMSPKIIGDTVKEYKKLASGKRAVVFAVSVKHSIAVVDEFKAQGIAALHVDGTTPAAQRDYAIESFAKGNIKILSNVGLFGEGFDLPAIEACILLRPTQSLGLYLQMVGRALRLSKGKEYATILDHTGNIVRHGLPCQKRQWSLTGTPWKERKKEQEQLSQVGKPKST